jgi:hypothetical protein
MVPENRPLVEGFSLARIHQIGWIEVRLVEFGEVIGRW